MKRPIRASHLLAEIGKTGFKVGISGRELYVVTPAGDSKPLTLVGTRDAHQTRFYLQKDFLPDDELVPYYEIVFFTDGKPLTSENALHVEDGGMIVGNRGTVLLRTEEEFM